MAVIMNNFSLLQGKAYNLCDAIPENSKKLIIIFTSFYYYVDIPADLLKLYIFLKGEIHMEFYVTSKVLKAFSTNLKQEGRTKGTIQKYMRDLYNFVKWSGHVPVSSQLVIEWRDHLSSEGYAPVTINSMLSALNKFFEFMGWQACKVKHLRIQRKIFREESRELNIIEYRRLLATAKRLGKKRLFLLMETICASGIRVSEIAAITVGAIKSGKADISLKGKIRTILLPKKLCRKLTKYAYERGIFSGPIFVSKRGQTLSRHQIWAEMKKLCCEANVQPSKVFPHNLRHLFARTFYEATHNIVLLADVLGHSRLETTRIYLISSGYDHGKQLEQLGLVI